MNILRSLFTRHSFYLVLLLLITLGYTGTYFWQMIHTDVMSGWDAEGHYVVNQYFSEHIFPQLYGWTNRWYSGMPWPLGYPPLYTYFFATLDHILPFSFFNIMRWTMILLTIFFPWMIYAIALRINTTRYQKPLSFLTALLSIFFLISSADLAGILGVTMGGTFENGLYPQFFAAWIFLLWFYVFLRNEQSQRQYWLSVILLGLLIITNIHVGEAALIIFVVMAIGWSLNRPVKQSFKRYGLHFLLSVGIGLFWYLPLLETIHYFPTQTITNVPPLVGLTSILVPLLFGIWGGALAFRSNDRTRQGIVMSAGVIFFVTIFPLHYIIPGLPIQPFRLLPISYLFFLLLMPAAMFWLVERFELTGKLAIIGIAVLMSPMLYWFPPVDKSIGGIFHLNREDPQLIDYVQTLHDGRTSFEVYYDKIPTPTLPYNVQPKNFILTARVGQEGVHETSWGHFRESSLVTPFIQPVRNTLSKYHEAFGVTCWLCTDNNNHGGYRSYELYYQPIENHFKRASAMGIKYLFVRTPRQRARMALDYTHLASEIKRIGQWSVYQLQADPQIATTLDRAPIALYTPLKTKGRPAEGGETYDWMRWNEEWLFHARFENRFLLPHESLDNEEELNQFQIAVIDEYNYKNEDEAYRVLTAFAQRAPLILIESEDPLYARLAEEKASLNVHIVPRTGDPRNDTEALLDMLESEVSVPAVAATPVASTDIQDEQMRVMLTEQPTSTQAVLLKYSYFPWWHEQHNKEIYMTSPAFMLVFTDQQSIDLEFRQSRIVLVGVILSLLSLSFCVYRCFSPRNRIQ